ncbi:MAG: ammonia channel protein, partial [Betaproteobacteria bacterium]
MKRFLTALAAVLAIGLASVTNSWAEEKPADTAAPAAAADSAAPAAAEAPADAAAEAPKLDSGSTAWMMTATVLVILMTIPGLALFYGGLVRQKNMLSVLMQVFVTFSVLSVVWVAAGYSLAFTEGSNFIG